MTRRRRKQAPEPDFNIGELLAVLDQKDDPAATPSWADGDWCKVRGHIGTLAGLGPGCASVVTNEGPWFFVGLEEQSPIA